LFFFVMETTTVPMSTTIKVGEESTPQGFSQMPSTPAPLIHYGPPPPHVHHFMKRKLRQGCCCLTFLILVNLIVLIQVAKKVTKLSHLVSPNSDVIFMPGGFKPFCSDLCVNLCIDNGNDNNVMNANMDMDINNQNVNNDNNDIPVHYDSVNTKTQMSTFSCELKSCLNSCSQYFENNDDSDDKKHRKHRRDKDDSSEDNSDASSEDDDDTDSKDDDDDDDDNKKNEVRRTNRDHEMNHNQVIY